MMYKVGKVNYYDGLNGTIVTPDIEYNFINSPLNSDNITNGDLVRFSDNNNEDFPIAYFVEPINISELKEDYKEYMLRKIDE